MSALSLTACGGGGGGGGDTFAPPPTQPALGIADARVIEGDTGTATLTFNVTLATASSQTVTAGFATANGNAMAGTDYVAASGPVSFAPGETTRTVSVIVNGDTLPEPTESFTVTLSAPTNAMLADASAVGTITNDDISPAVSGLDGRPDNSGCVAPPRPTADSTVDTTDAFPGAPSFSAPTKILQAPGDATRWFVLEKSGRVKVLGTGNPTGATTWLDWSGLVNEADEGGLLGLAFHPNWPATREVFLSYTTDGAPLVSRVSRLILDNVTTPVNVTEQILLTVDQPYTNHKGGEIVFGPDGSLYFGLGDGGSGGDPQDRAQNPTQLLGKMLRINVAGVGFPNPGYTIPADNPFAANPKCGPGSNAQACPEIYASGLRNPWRFSFDPATGQLWAGDVGQGDWEEVDVIERGGNFGWRCREGFHDYNTANCPAGGLVEPVTDYSHANGDASITGGYVYRGAGIPALRGRYVFGDFVSGRIWALEKDGEGGYSNDELANTPYNISAFAIGADGELYFADYYNGRIRRVIPSTGGPLDTIPEDLADTGCVMAGNPSQPAPGMVQFSVNAPFWSDGASKERYLAIPDDTTIGISSNNDFDFPPGTVILKNFRLANQLIETRLMMRHPDGVWAGYTYAWNNAETAATRVVGGQTREVGGQTWIYPSEGECMQCHTAAAGFSLGPEISQFNGMMTYAATGRTANQLDTLDAIGMFSTALPDVPANLPALVDPAETAAPLTDRARAYLHTNCAQCHRPGGPTPSSMDLKSTTALAATHACNAAPQAGSLGIANPLLIAPGDASRSVLIARISRRDAHGMPPLGSSLPDVDGIALLTQWINALANCQ